MKLCVDTIHPNAIVHLGDHYSDGEVLAETYPQIPVYLVPGNCDSHRGWIRDPEIRIEKICGIYCYLTHGHRHQVKSGLYALMRDARAAQVQLALFGHTHSAYCQQEPDGLWVVNPGSCGYYGGSAALIEAEQGNILSVRIIKSEDL